MPEGPVLRTRWWSKVGAFLVLAGAVLGGYLYLRDEAASVPPSVLPAAATGDITAQVHEFCGACHAYPPADTFPRSAWKGEVEQGYLFFADSNKALPAPPVGEVVRYYEERAPETLPPAAYEKATEPPSVRLVPRQYPLPTELSPAAISNLQVAHLTRQRLPEILACDMRWGHVMALRTADPAPAWRILGKVSHPAHIEVVDLDGDGINDLLVADLGSFEPTDRRTGRVVWLRGRKDGSFTPYTLLEGVGRVADVQAADFRNVGRLDLVVAVFGWRKTGEVVYLENQTTDWNRPKFVSRILDDRHGCIHVPVADLNRDGRPDFVALISQEHETVVAFLNDGAGGFHKETLYTASHPGYGSSGIQLVDLDGDGALDVLYTNGDTLDKPYLLKAYHGVQWLRNPGRFPFEHHPITPFYGVHRAVAADFSGTGRQDIAAVSFLPVEGFPERERLALDSILFLEQTGPGRFARHSLETVTCDHVTCAVGDIFGNGRPDVVTAPYGMSAAGRTLTIWKNESPGRAPAAPARAP
jgi:hypothetical protein